MPEAPKLGAALHPAPAVTPALFQGCGGIDKWEVTWPETGVLEG